MMCTYIQSGNAVFRSAEESRDGLRKQIQDAVELQFNFRPALLLLSASDFGVAMVNNPFPQAADSPKTLHFFFLDSPPAAPDLDTIGKLAGNSETFALVDRVFYLHAPEGIGRSKLAASVERKLGVTATARNLNTIARLSAMLSEAKSRAV
jgi:uncharacterized protein (DUF1697 family)